MKVVLEIVNFLLRFPLAALAPAVLFFLFHRFKPNSLILIAAASWTIYAAYEWLMQARVLCSGECNIRIDLLVLYPLLLLVSVAALVALFLPRKRPDGAA